MFRHFLLFCAFVIGLSGVFLSSSFAEDAANPVPVTTEDLTHLEKTVLHQNKLQDEKLAAKFEQQDKLLADEFEQQDKRINDIFNFANKNSNSISMLAIFIAVAAAFTFIFSALKAKSQVKDWVKDNGPAVLDKYIKDNIKNQMDERLKDIEAKLETQNDKYLAELRASMPDQLEADTGSEEDQDQVEKIKSAAKDIANELPTDRTYEEWFTLGLTYFWDEAYKQAADAFQKAAGTKDVTDQQVAVSLSNKSSALNKDGQFREAVAISDMIEKRFWPSQNPLIRKSVAAAQNNKAYGSLRIAKEVWQGDTGGVKSKEFLATALERAGKTVKHDPNHIKALRSQGLALFLLEREDEAEPVFERAFRLGDEEFYKLVLKDIEACPEVKAVAFLEFVQRIWAEVEAAR